MSSGELTKLNEARQSVRRRRLATNKVSKLKAVSSHYKKGLKNGHCKLDQVTAVFTIMLHRYHRVVLSVKCLYTMYFPDGHAKILRH